PGQVTRIAEEFIRLHEARQLTDLDEFCARYTEPQREKVRKECERLLRINVLANEPDRLTPGQTLASYKIVELIGAGGMGEVYRARDSKLDREVAIKVLRPELACQSDRVKRFEREAKAIAALDHPNILTVHTVEESDGLHFITMQLVEGKTLAQMIPKKGMSLEKFFDLAIPMADAIGSAHDHGITHRDLKPANIMVTAEGRVEILDFGLAKLRPPVTADRATDLSISSLTEEGRIIGTVAYMSPEQAEGEAVDHRTDIFSLGIILYEMVTGERPFNGETPLALRSSIVKDTPTSVLAMNPRMPIHLGRIIRLSMEKDPERRFQSAKDLRNELANLKRESDSGEAVIEPVHADTRRGWVWPAISGGLLVALLFVLLVSEFALVGGNGPRNEVERHAMHVEGGHEMWLAESPSIAVSSQGAIGFVADNQLYVKHSDRAHAEPLDGTEDARNPFFSPGGERIGFCQDQQIKWMPVAGGPITSISGAKLGYDTAGATWGSDDQIIYRDGGLKYLLQIPAEGGAPQPLTEDEGPQGSFHLWPQLVDDGRQLLFTMIGSGGMWEDASLELLDLETRQRDTVRERATFGRYVAGHMVYAEANGSIQALPYDLSRRNQTGEPFLVETGVRVALWGGAASFAVAPDGRTAAMVHGSHDERVVMQWVDRRGELIHQIGRPLPGGIFVRISPDGQQVATDFTEPTNGELYRIDTDERGERYPFTNEPAYDWTPVWSPRGDQIAYSSWDENYRLGIYIWDEARGTRELLHQVDPASDLWLHSWSLEGWIAYVQSLEGDRSIYAVNVDGRETVLPVATTSDQEWSPQFSPDGKRLAYESDQEVFVINFPDLDGHAQVSNEGGFDPRWSRESNELFYWKPNNRLVVRKVLPDGSFGLEKELFRAPEIASLHSYDVSADGEQILLSLLNPEAKLTEIIVVENWIEHLKQQAPRMP
ncbi:MAG: protein kinase domain-containing protein, partial [Planctomycetota bacterium]